MKSWVHSLRSLFLLLVLQIPSDCLGLLLGVILPLHSPSWQGLMHVPTVHVGFAVWNCDWVLGVKAANGFLLVGVTVVSIGFSVTYRFSAFSFHCLWYELRFMNWAPQEIWRFHVVQTRRELQRSAGLRREKILSATKGSPPRYSSLRMSMHAGREGECSSELLGVACRQ